jgi:hypothetical protein
LGQLQIDDGKLHEGRRTLQEARQLIDTLPRLQSEDYFHLARLRAQLSRLAGAAKPLATDREGAEQQPYLDQALDALRKAVAAGFDDAAKLKEDPTLDPVRGRDDFRKLLAQLEAAKK